MGLFLLGKKVTGLGIFAKGIYDLEQAYKEKHADLKPEFSDRWDKAIKFYNETHTEPTNRKLHIMGIPLVLAGTAGMLTNKSYTPAWFLSASSFAVGWGMNIGGHLVFEKNDPAFLEDPLSFVAGPVWDIKQLVKRDTSTGSVGSREA
ncbi:MAG: DUF962 domain-containing protein [Candidatus Sericytochromatia bacterium]